MQRQAERMKQLKSIKEQTNKQNQRKSMKLKAGS